MALDLIWQHKNINRVGTTYLYLVLKIDDATNFTPVNCDFIISGSDNIIACSSDLSQFGAAQPGQTFVIENSVANDKRYNILSLDQDGAVGREFRYFVIESIVAGDDATGFNIRVENSSIVDADQTPALFKWGEENSSKYKEIQRSYCDLFLIGNTGMEYQDFFNNPVGTYLPQVYKSGGLFFYGVGITDQYLEPLLAPPYTVRLTFSDGTALAAARKFYIDDPNIRLSLIELYAHALSSGTTMALQIREAVNIYESQMNITEGDSALTQCDIDPETWYQGGGHTFGSCITELNKFFGARLFQEDGVWYVTRVNEYSGDYVQRSFDSAGVFDSFNWENTTTSITLIKGETGDMSLLPLAKNIKITHDEARTNFIENAYFEKWNGGLTSPLDWVLSALTVTRVEDGTTGRYALKTQVASPSTSYMQATIKLDPLAATHLFHDNVAYTMEVNVIPGIRGDARFDYSVAYGVEWLDGVGGWALVETKITHNYTDTAKLTEFNKIRIPLDFSGSGNPGTPGTLQLPVIVKIFGSPGDGSTFDYITIVDDRGYRIDPDTVIRTAGEEGGGDLAIAMRLKTGNISGTPTDPERRQVIDNPSSTDTNQVWERRGVTEALGVDDILIDAINDETNVNQLRVNMTLVDVDVKIRRPLVIPALPNKRFMSNGVTFNPALNEWSGEWIEIISTPTYTELPPP